MTQAKLLDIAVAEFGRKGREGASTRSIAAAAGTAMSSITYHYGGKDGLYLAAADRIAARMEQEMASALSDERAIADDDTLGARAAVHRVLGRFIEKMASGIHADIALFILREQFDPTEAFDRIYAGLMGRLLDRLVSLVCIATGVRDRRAAQIVTVTLMGQAMAVRSSRGAILRLLGTTALDQDILAEFTARVRANTDAILDTMGTERQEPR